MKMRVKERHLSKIKEGKQKIGKSFFCSCIFLLIVLPAFLGGGEARGQASEAKKK